MTNLPEFPSAMSALDKVQHEKLSCPYKCTIRKQDGLIYEAEITLSTQGYCLSAVEPTRLHKDIKWLEYLERRTNETAENKACAEAQQSTLAEVGQSTS
jgi:hypothetical protein